MHTEIIKRIQQALLQHGFAVGLVDGVWGRRTIAAVKAFQEKKGLAADGIVGPKTAAVLFAGEVEPNTGTLLPWLAEATNLVGTKEVLGSRSNPIILNWADELDARYSGDDIPWCGLFVAHCVGSTMPEEILPGNPLGARQWEKFGDPTEPRFGAILVFWREARSSWKGHVGFYTGEDAHAFRILGGNQSDKVCYTWISKTRLVSARWPRTASQLGNSPAIVLVERTEDLSTNEA